MHATLDEAKKYCEERRTNGSVFYITEMPAIVAQFNYGKLIATQINAATPFESYSTEENITTGIDIKKNEKRTPSTIEELTTSLNTSSAHWKQPKQNNQPVILLWLFDPNAYISPIKEKTLTKYKSFSHGKKYLLGWSTLEKSTNPTRVIEIAESYETDPKSSKIRNISSTKTAKNSSSSCNHEKAAKDIAYSICGRLTKAYGKAVQLQETSKIDSHKFKVKLGVEFFQAIKNITYIISTNSDAEVVDVEHVDS